jgi:hypothetical protein
MGPVGGPTRAYSGLVTLSNWTYWGPVTMPTYRAMRWKLFGPEPTGPRSPHYRVFPRRPP